jgi:hypothetical protein
MTARYQKMTAYFRYKKSLKITLKPSKTLKIPSKIYTNPSKAHPSYVWNPYKVKAGNKVFV